MESSNKIKKNEKTLEQGSFWELLVKLSLPEVVVIRKLDTSKPAKPHNGLFFYVNFIFPCTVLCHNRSDWEAFVYEINDQSISFLLCY